MSRQEIAIALSHIEVWKRIAWGDSQFSLVLEDDVYFRRGFSETLDEAWDDLQGYIRSHDFFDMLYISYEEAKIEPQKRWVSDVLYRPAPGLWQLSGYVLSKKGAKKLLQLLPVRGPVDLWINHQFTDLDIFAACKSLVEQRKDIQSSNSYSILPLLTKLGVLTENEPELFEPRDLPSPVFAVGGEGAGYTSLAMALSMLGYRCCSDVKQLPQSEYEELFGRGDNRIFNAYVNVGSIEKGKYHQLAKKYPEGKFIILTDDQLQVHVRKTNESWLDVPVSYDRRLPEILRVQYELKKTPADFLTLMADCSNKWKRLCDFLDCSPPSHRYPELQEQGQRPIRTDEARCTSRSDLPQTIELDYDSAPWIVQSSEEWDGVPLQDTDAKSRYEKTDEITFGSDRVFHGSSWGLREDTFSSNLALFDPNNFTTVGQGLARLTLREDTSSVRDYTSAAVYSRRSYRYGSFSAVVKPATSSGLVTGIFLHRNSPRQEIDIELLGKDTTKMLVNVYYNPGQEGSRLEYGYRGTPILVDLGFDASEDLHQYTIEWSAVEMRWLVDGRVVHRRNHWNPTPIPHLPMKFNMNLWSSRSEELAGGLRDDDLPGHSYVESITVSNRSVSSPGSRA